MLGAQSQRITVEGRFLKNPKFQHGKVSLSNGSVYEGDLKNFFFHGKGKQTWRMFGHISGSFLHGKIDGYAELTSDYYLYKGEFKDNKRHGIGFMWIKNQGLYMGQWVNNWMHGYGVIKGTSGAEIGCQFEHGRFVKSQLQSFSYDGVINERILKRLKKKLSRFIREHDIDKYYLFGSQQD